MLSLFAQAAEDGFAERNGDVVDIFALVALILFVIAFIFRLVAKPIVVDALCIAAGFVALAIVLLFI
jgi:hypothetical protein